MLISYKYLKLIDGERGSLNQHFASTPSHSVHLNQLILL